MNNTRHLSILKYAYEYAGLIATDRNVTSFKEPAHSQTTIAVVLNAFCLMAYCNSHNISDEDTEQLMLDMPTIFYSTGLLTFATQTHISSIRQYSTTYVSLSLSPDICNAIMQLYFEESQQLYNVFKFYYNQIATNVPPAVAYNIVRTSYAPPLQLMSPPRQTPPIVQRTVKQHTFSQTKSAPFISPFARRMVDSWAAICTFITFPLLTFSSEIIIALLLYFTQQPLPVIYRGLSIFTYLFFCPFAINFCLVMAKPKEAWPHIYTLTPIAIIGTIHTVVIFGFVFLSFLRLPAPELFAICFISAIFYKHINKTSERIILGPAYWYFSNL